MATKPPNMNLIHPNLKAGASSNPIFIEIGLPDHNNENKKAKEVPFLSKYFLLSLDIDISRFSNE